MSEESSEPRQVSGHRPALASLQGKIPGAGQEASPGSIMIGLVARAVSRRLTLIVSVTALTTIVALLAFRQPAIYRATALIRLAGERRVLSAVMEQAVPELDRNSAPLQSLVPRLRSRTLIGQVVDSLGLRLHPVSSFSLWGASTQPPLGLRSVKIDSSTEADTLLFSFSDSAVSVKLGSDSSRVRYGTPVRLRSVQFTVPARPAVDRALVAVVPREVAIDKLLGQLAIVPVTGTDALQVNYLDSDPATAQQIANQIVKTFNAGNISSSQEQARRRGVFLAEQLARTDQLLGRAQANLSGFRSRHELANSANRVTAQQSAIMTLDVQLGELQTELRVFKTLLSQMESPDDSARAEGLRSLAYSPEVATDRIVERIYEQVLIYHTRLDSLTTGPWQSSGANPDVVQLRQLLRSAENELGRAIRTRVKSLETRIDAVTELRNSTTNDMQALPAFQAEEARLDQQVSTLSDFANQLRLEFQRSQLSEELAAGDIEIVDLASEPYLPAGIPWWVKTAVALVLGLGLSSGLAVFLEMRNRSIREPEQLEQILQVPGLGVIPPIAEGASAQGLIGAKPGNGRGLFGRPGGRTPELEQPSIGAEAFRLLYASLTYGWGDRPRTILVTSVAPQEGKTLIAGNLAATFAREGAEVLLIDCDLRRPRLHSMFGVSRSPGLLNMLQPNPAPEPESTAEQGRSPAARSYSFFPAVERPLVPTAPIPGVSRPGVERADAVPPELRGTHVRSTRVKGLWLLSAGSSARRPAETLRVDAMRSLLQRFSEHFDVIIIDTPPALVSADSAILAPLADDVLMVVRAGCTDRDAVERTWQHLTAAGARVVGAVLNDPEGKVAGGRLYYGYSYPADRDGEHR
jgi:succinoglycan biosynthesis transport protein ExoP